MKEKTLIEQLEDEISELKQQNESVRKQKEDKSEGKYKELN